jgi:hypothetical protein
MKTLLLAFAILAFGSMAPLSAAIVFVESPTIPIPQNIGGVYLNVATGSTSASEPGNWSSAPWLNPFYGGVYVGSSDLFRPVIVGSDQIVNLSAGSVVDGTQNFAPPVSSGSTTHMGAAANQFQPNTPGYIGFQMKTSPTSATYYGWMRVSFNNTGAGSILSYAYESTPSTGITVGVSAVPEPSRALLLMLGALSLAIRRRRS